MFDLNQIKFEQPTAEDVRVLRARMGINQKELCRRLGISLMSMSFIETGRRNMKIAGWVAMQVVYYRDFVKND